MPNGPRNKEKQPPAADAEAGVDRPAGDADETAEPLVIRMPVDVRSLSLTVIASLALVLMLQYAESVLIPIVIGILISYALSPMVTAMAKRHIPRAIGAAVAVLVLVGSIGAGVYTLSDEARSIVANVPEAARRLRERVSAHRTERDTHADAGAGCGQGDREDRRRGDRRKPTRGAARCRKSRSCSRRSAPPTISGWAASGSSAFSASS